MLHDAKPIEILVMSDNHITRSGLRSILEAQAEFCVVGEHRVSAVTLAGPLVHVKPDVIVLDLDPESIDSSECMRILKTPLVQASAVILLCNLGLSELVRKALARGAAGVILKTQPPSALVAVIHSVMGVRRRCPNGLVSQEQAMPAIPEDRIGFRIPDEIHTLTDREREIVGLIALGMKNKEVAHRLHISDITVRHHLTNIFSKLNVTDRQKLLILAHKHGIVTAALSRSKVG